MDRISKKFLHVLKEQDDEREAMEASLDDGVSPDQYDTNMEPAPSNGTSIDDKISDALSQRNQEIIDQLQGWIDTIEGFLKFLNSEDPSSVQSKLASAEPDTVMDKMKQSQQTKISRVASDLASLHQNFLGFMAQTQNARYKYV